MSHNNQQKYISLFSAPSSIPAATLHFDQIELLHALNPAVSI
jgi:hypothetical protein